MYYITTRILGKVLCIALYFTIIPPGIYRLHYTVGWIRNVLYNRKNIHISGKVLEVRVCIVRRNVLKITVLAYVIYIPG
jgi:hypothetical protein